jgi:hypothetical protein
MDLWRPLKIHMDIHGLMHQTRSGSGEQEVPWTTKEKLPPKWVFTRPAGRIDWGYHEVVTVQSFKDEELWWPMDEDGHVIASAAEKAYPGLVVDSDGGQNGRQRTKGGRQPKPPDHPRVGGCVSLPSCRRLRKPSIVWGRGEPSIVSEAAQSPSAE